MKKRINKTLYRMAKSNGYIDIGEMLRDYGIMPSVLMPKHKRSEFIVMLLKFKKH